MTQHEPSASMVSASPQDAYPPAQIAGLVGEVGVCKATMPAIQTTMLGVLAGAFIAFGAMFFTLVMSGSALGFGPGRLLGGVAFSLGLLLVVGGAELFTGNNLIVMPWAERKITTLQLLRNWGLVYLANLAGALGTALMVHWSGTLALGDGAVAASAGSPCRSQDRPSLRRGVLSRRLVQYLGLPRRVALLRGA
jgi:formate/nitrite transporter FocA (FNT family)